MPRSGRYFVYMVRCADGTYYTGTTSNLAARVKRHNAGQGAKYVRGRAPVRLVYSKGCADYRTALQAEYRLKQQSRREKQLLAGTNPVKRKGKS